MGVVPGSTIFCRGFYASTRPLTHILRRYARLSTPAASDTQYENNAVDPHGGFCVFSFLLYNHSELASFDPLSIIIIDNIIYDIHLYTILTRCMETILIILHSKYIGPNTAIYVPYILYILQYTILYCL